MRSLPKIFWVVLIFVILVWVGVGVYYFSTHTASPTKTLISPETPTPATSENLDETHFIVGNFQEWEEIEGSNDRYILLTDPQTNQPFPKIRVGFEFSPLFGYDGNDDITVFAVQKSKDENDYDVLYTLKYFSDKEISRLIKKDSWIKVSLQKEGDKEENRKDADGYLLAHLLLIKREGGKAAIEQELGREIERPKNP